MLLLDLMLLVSLSAGVRDSGPCSEWFDNAWLKSKGYSADVCCWRNHSDCWRDGHSYGSCCVDYDVSRYEGAFASLGHPLLSALEANLELRQIALPVSPESVDLDGSPLDGRAAQGADDGRCSTPLYDSPRDFFRAALPVARMALDVVEKSHGGTSASLVLFVMTAPGNFARRATIRQTWLHTALWPGAEGTRYAFVVGAPDEHTRTRIPDIDRELRDEQALHGDVLLLPILQDVYWGWEHTAKTFLALVAVLARAPEAEHFACLHDDVFVHLPRLVALLPRITDSRGHHGCETAGGGLYLGNAYKGHDFVGFSEDDGPDYEVMHGHRKMPVIMKGGLWVVDRVLACWVAGVMAGPAATLSWKLWPSDDDSVGLVFGELDIHREHRLRHGIEWFDWRLGDRCDGDQLAIAHDLKTPRELLEMWARQLAFNNPCYGIDPASGAVRLQSRPEDFM
eukprot:gnl/TRDRNA2_/TRDRNA2_167404_c1_seq1.p1 gnl/TRDRNA2_/TRDRNA2_167404_c1~~gnl/TRDRNA2_/TRDRNA2_167404_c1_seq1.p1  ORF type:complete len:453 (+),score=60.26 gnl/TRDRNA2_/TRDRNA2_167404_c1_seq1:60-1418(+)